MARSPEGGKGTSLPKQSTLRHSLGGCGGIHRRDRGDRRCDWMGLDGLVVLRRAKERRQVIIVTHNPNVAVLGDAEQIIVMKAMNDRGEIVARGSIDHVATRDAACAILEGAREAFLRRAKMYGIQLLSLSNEVIE
jgi:hypothetical protein